MGNSCNAQAWSNAESLTPGGCQHMHHDELGSSTCRKASLSPSRLATGMGQERMIRGPGASWGLDVDSPLLPYPNHQTTDSLLRYNLPRPR